MKKLTCALAVALASIVGSAGAVTLNEGEYYELSFSSIDLFGTSFSQAQGGVSVDFQNSTFAFGEQLLLQAYEDYGDAAPQFQNIYSGIFGTSELGNDSDVDIGFTMVNPPLWASDRDGYFKITALNGSFQLKSVEYFARDGSNFYKSTVTFDRLNVDGTVIPLPASLPLLLAGLASLGWIGSRRRRKLAGWPCMPAKAAC